MNTSNLPWIEKYRPKLLGDISGHDEKINTLKNLIAKNELPHLLFYGPPGTGKTSLILAVAREMYGNEFKMHILELNASDDRGIDIVRNKIPDFVKTKSSKLRLVILDEADAMTQDAQCALRRVMETYIETSRFCLICNNFNKIVQGLKSRCSIMRFGILPSNQVETRIGEITQLEGVLITQEAIQALVELQRDFRQILNTLQCLHYIRLGGSSAGVNHDYQQIETSDIYAYLGKPSKEETAEIIHDLFTGNFQDNYNHLLELFRDNKWNIQDLITHLGREVVLMDIDDEKKYYLLEALSKIEYRIINGRNSEIQLGALVAAFKK